MHQSIQDAKEVWRKTIHGDGGVCPCCERWGKVYTRTINKTMAASLQWLYDETLKSVGQIGNWVDVPNTAPKSVLRSNQLPSLRWWGLVERQLPDPQDKAKKHSGMWRITLRGIDFVEGKHLVPKKILTYNTEAVGFGDELVNFKTASGIKFDMEAVMTSTAVLQSGALFAATGPI